MNPWYFQCRSVTARKVPRWFRDSPGIMHLWLVWWMWCWRGNAAEGLWRPEGVNISKGRVRVEGMERSHVAAENIREQRRMLRMKFYVTIMQSLSFFWQLIHLSIRILNPNPMILFLLERDGNWQWYSTNTPDGWKFIKIAIFGKKTWSRLEFNKFLKKNHSWQFQVLVSRTRPGPNLDMTQVQVWLTLDLDLRSGSRVRKKWLDCGQFIDAWCRSL